MEIEIYNNCSEVPINRVLLQCLVDSKFAIETDKCILNPANCVNGTSVSVFYKLEFDVNPKDLENFTKTFERETILSTGGDYGVPGFQIYRDGPILGALLSTGDETWEVRIVVRGNHGINFRF